MGAGKGSSKRINTSAVNNEVDNQPVWLDPSITEEKYTMVRLPFVDGDAAYVYISIGKHPDFLSEDGGLDDYMGIMLGNSGNIISRANNWHAVKTGIMGKSPEEIIKNMIVTIFEDDKNYLYNDDDIDEIIMEFMETTDNMRFSLKDVRPVKEDRTRLKHIPKRTPDAVLYLDIENKYIGHEGGEPYDPDDPYTDQGTSYETNTIKGFVKTLPDDTYLDKTPFFSKDKEDPAEDIYVLHRTYADYDTFSRSEGHLEVLGAFPNPEEAEEYSKLLESNFEEQWGKTVSVIEIEKISRLRKKRKANPDLHF